MTRGWGAVRRACAPAGRLILHFALDGVATLTFKVFRADDCRLACSVGDGLAGDHLPCCQGN